MSKVSRDRRVLIDSQNELSDLKRVPFIFDISSSILQSGLTARPDYFCTVAASNLGRDMSRRLLMKYYR